MSQEEKSKVEPHEEDDCEDCVKERAENNQLISIYERLNKIKAKVSNMKPNISNYTTSCKDNETKLTNINDRIKNPVNLDLSQINEKEMGYELAYALMEREMKLKKQNQILAQRIKERKEINESQINKSSIKVEVKEPKAKTERYNDSLDEIRESKSGFWLHPSPRNPKSNNSKLSNYSNSFTVLAQNSSTSSSFQNEDKKKYPDLNLWLYQLNIEAQEQALYKTGVEKKQRMK